MENNQNQKVGLTTINWVLSIGGILLLCLLIALPPIFRIVFEDETIIDNSDNNNSSSSYEEKIDDSNLAKVTCMRQTTFVDYIDNSIIILAHENNLLKVLTDDVTYTYLLDTKESENLYAEKKLSCNSDADSFSKLKGLSYLCDVSKDSVQITRKYDLSKFKIDDNNVELNPLYKLDQNVSEITSSLTAEGYVCE